MGSFVVTDHEEVVRADTLGTKRATLRVFVRRGSARVFAIVAAVALAARRIVGDFALGDGVVTAVTVIAVGPMGVT